MANFKFSPNNSLWWQRWQQLGLAILLASLLLLVGGCQPSTTSPPGVTQLTLWHGINPPPNRDVFQELVDRFNETHASIQVEALYVGQPDQQLPKILTAVVGDAPPDILWYNPVLTGKLVDLGAIRPIDDFLENSPVKSEIDPALFDSMQLFDRTWSVPMGTNNAGIFYRRDLFREAGIDKIPETWEELRQVASQLTQDTDGDGDRDRYGILLPLGKGEWTVFCWLPFMYSAGGSLLSDSQPNLVNEGAIEALQLWSQLLADGSAINSQPERGYEQSDFIKGRVAMQITGPWTLGYLPETGVDFGVFPFPSKNQPAAVVGGENLFVMQTNPEREQAAWKFLEYTVGKEFQQQWALQTGYLPANLQARRSEAYQEFIAQQPSLQVFLDQMQWAYARPIIPEYARLSRNLGRAIESVLLGTSPQAALEQAQSRLERTWNPTKLNWEGATQ